MSLTCVRPLPSSLCVFNSLCGVVVLNVSQFLRPLCRLGGLRGAGVENRPVEVSGQPARASLSGEVRVVKIASIHPLLVFSSVCWSQRSHRLRRTEPALIEAHLCLCLTPGGECMASNFDTSLPVSEK